jgi:hypothetical protein
LPDAGLVKFVGGLQENLFSSQLLSDIYEGRIYSQKLFMEEAVTITGKKFRLLNLPFYLIHKIGDYLDLLVS